MKEETPEIIEQISISGDRNYDEVQKYYKENYKEVFKRFIAEKDPEFDSIAKLHLVNELFDNFDNIEDDEEALSYLHLYLETVTEKTGLEHVHPESIETIMTSYMIDTELRARMLFPNMLENRREDESEKDFIDAVLGEAYLSAFPEYGIGNYIRERVITIMQDYKNKEIAQIDAIHRHGHAYVLMQAFAARETLRIEKTMTDEHKRILNEQAKALDEKLRAEFAEKLNT